MPVLPPELESFRQEVRTFLAEKRPDDLRCKTRTERMELATKRWARLLNDQGGWSCPGWPEEAGGPGWSCDRRFG